MPHDLREFNNSNAREGRGGSPALRETTRRWPFHGMGRGKDSLASPCGNPVSFTLENRNPGRCFRESRCRPRAQTKLSIFLVKTYAFTGGSGVIFFCTPVV